MEQNPTVDVTVHRYPLLRFMSLLYKIAAAVVFIAASVSALIAVSLSLGIVRDNAIVAFTSGALGFVLTGGLGALGLYTFARLIDLFLDTNNNTRQIAAAMEEQNRLLRQIQRRAADPYPRKRELS